MAHFAELDERNIVTSVIVVDNFRLGDDPAKEEERGVEYLRNVLGNRRWAQTSFNGKFRKQFAGIGYFFDSDNDVFIEPQPFPSWKLDANFDWQPPIARPTYPAIWDEESLSWVELPSE